MVKRLGSYLFRVLIALDQLCNVVVLGGSPDHTVSGRVGYRAHLTSKWYWLVLQAVINALFFFDSNHCYNAIEWDRVKKDKLGNKRDITL